MNEPVGKTKMRVKEDMVWEIVDHAMEVGERAQDHSDSETFDEYCLYGELERMLGEYLNSKIKDGWLEFEVDNTYLDDAREVWKSLMGIEDEEEEEE